MKDLLANLWEHLKSTTAQTRLVIGASMMLLLAVAGVMSYRAANPHLVPAFTGLDNTQFSAVTNALASEGIRFDASSPPGPYSVFVPVGELYQARNAVAAKSALSIGAKGIQSAEGSGGMFDSSFTRQQRNRKRDWQDLELQLEALVFIQAALVRSSGLPQSPLIRNVPPTVSVVVHVIGGVALDATQRRTLASIVRHGANVPDENITIADQDGQTLFDGASDQALGDVLRFEKEWADVWTTQAQEQLDTIFGPGLTSVRVMGEFDHEFEESVDESVDPATKAKLSETSLESKTPMDSSFSGGPAGTQTNIQSANAPATGRQATESETDTRYTYGRKTTHKKKSAPALVRMTVNLAVHDSLRDRMTDAEGLVKRLVRFNEDRDDFYAAALPLASVQLDEEGNPVLSTAEPPPAPPSRTMTLLIERGVEILAAGAFLFVLLRSLKRGVATKQVASASDETPTASEMLPIIPDEELDLDLLARKHVEQMLESDPEKVAALLSRWALGESFYAGAKS